MPSLSQSRSTTKQGRATLVTAGTYFAIPSAFPEASPGVRNAFKFDIRPFTPADALDDQQQLALFPDRVLVDFVAVDTDAIDTERLVKDCDLVSSAVRRDPAAVAELIAGLQAGSADGIAMADRAARRLGLSEQQVTAAGGGLFFLAVLVIAAVAAGGCVKKGTQVKPGNEATTPGHGVGSGGAPSDGGTPDGGPQDGGVPR
jgi:hypothetical protein